MTTDPTIIPIIIPGAVPVVAHEPGAGPTVREATPADAPAIHQLIMDNLQAGHLLPRSLADVTARASRFAVVVSGEGVLLACGELAPLNASVAEVRSLVVREDARGKRLGHVIVDELRRRARAGRYRTLCAFTHDPRFFVRFGFSIVQEPERREFFLASGRTPRARSISCSRSALLRTPMIWAWGSPPEKRIKVGMPLHPEPTCHLRIGVDVQLHDLQLVL